MEWFVVVSHATRTWTPLRELYLGDDCGFALKGKRERRYCAAKGAALSHRSRYLPRSLTEGITGQQADKSLKPGLVGVTLRVIREHDLNALARRSSLLSKNEFRVIEKLRRLLSYKYDFTILSNINQNLRNISFLRINN